MRFHSTRGGETVGLDEALLRGIAADGGLFLPEALPKFSAEDFAQASSLQETAALLLEPFFDGSRLQDELDGILAETYRFPIPLSKLSMDDGDAWLLELYHGPTAAFKDVGAGFLAACLSRLHDAASASPLVILVATSGDTGGAVAAAFNRRPGVNVVVLYPKGRVSERQAKQLTCWSDNVLSFEVDGSFDECQAMVKAAFADPEVNRHYQLSSANSINIGRLLPQSTYYANASLCHWRDTGRKPGFIIPTGNLGNALACILARDMGLPIGPVVLATNENRIISDFLDGAQWLPRASIQTLASAMDVGNPSNMERLRKLHGESSELSALVSSVSVTDAQIETEIRDRFAQFGRPFCPHTATATYALRQMSPEQRNGDWILVATAHAAKFESIVEPLIGEAVPVPHALAQILSHPSRFTSIDATPDALVDALNSAIRVDGTARASDK